MIYLMTTLYAIRNIPDYEGYRRKIEGLITEPLGKPLVSIKILGEDVYWTFFQSEERRIEDLERRIRSELGYTFNRIIPVIVSEIGRSENLLKISKKEWPVLYFLFGTRERHDFDSMKGKILGIHPTRRREFVLAQIRHPRYNFLAALSGSELGEIGNRLQHILNTMRPQYFSMKMGAKHGWHGDESSLHDDRITSVAGVWSSDPTAGYIS